MNEEILQKIDRIRRAISVLRIPATPGEYDLHAMIAEALAGAGIACRHEVLIAPRCRIDFLVEDIGIEVKQGKQPTKKLRQQAEKYLASPELSALIVVTTRGAFLSGTIGGKPVEIVGLNRLWGVALP